MLKDADCMLLLTEWNEFRRPDFEKMKELLIHLIKVMNILFQPNKIIIVI